MWVVWQWENCHTGHTIRLNTRDCLIHHLHSASYGNVIHTRCIGAFWKYPVDSNVMRGNIITRLFWINGRQMEKTIVKLWNELDSPSTLVRTASKLFHMDTYCGVFYEIFDWMCICLSQSWNLFDIYRIWEKCVEMQFQSVSPTKTRNIMMLHEFDVKITIVELVFCLRYAILAIMPNLSIERILCFVYWMRRPHDDSTKL